MSCCLLNVVPSRSVLLTELRTKDICVPPRNCKRNQRKHVEPYVIYRLLASLAVADRVEYPVSLKHRDKPDFKLTLGNCSVGVEVSEIIENSYAHFAAAANRDVKEEEPFLREPGHFRGSRVFTKKEMQERLKEMQKAPDKFRLTAQPSYGDEPEREWASHMACQIGAKQREFAQYEKFEVNWLALYDNLHCPGVNLHTALDLLLKALLPNGQAAMGFDAIFMESGKSIIKITPERLEWIGMSDLWEA
jgi:hypothetical protein